MPYENVLHTTAYPLLSRIPAPVLEMLFFLEEKGFEAWIVGGFVRDALRGVALTMPTLLPTHDGNRSKKLHLTMVAK